MTCDQPPAGPRKPASNGATSTITPRTAMAAATRQRPRPHVASHMDTDTSCGDLHHRIICCMESSGDAVVPVKVITGAVIPGSQAQHYSTGRLTRGQAAAVNSWRARLLGMAGDGPVRQSLIAGEDLRPRASCSDAIAAAVADLLLRRHPLPLEVARYVYASMLATREPSCQESGAQLYPPVSWYLPRWLTGHAEDLRARARAAALHAHTGAAEEAARLYPGKSRAAALARCLYKEEVLAQAGLPLDRQIPRGAIARMAIDLWASRHPDSVAVDAVAYAAMTHQQPHRARRDMRRLAR
jgi:hypothetical protein